MLRSENLGIVECRGLLSKHFREYFILHCIAFAQIK